MTAKNNNRLSTVELREAFFIVLYKKVFPTIALNTARMGGSLEEAKRKIFSRTRSSHVEFKPITDAQCF